MAPVPVPRRRALAPRPFSVPPLPVAVAYPLRRPTTWRLLLQHSETMTRAALVVTRTWLIASLCLSSLFPLLRQCEEVRSLFCPRDETCSDIGQRPGLRNDAGVPIGFPAKFESSGRRTTGCSRHSSLPLSPPSSSWGALSPRSRPRPRCATKDCSLSCAHCRRTSWARSSSPSSPSATRSACGRRTALSARCTRGAWRRTASLVCGDGRREYGP